jgi:2-polyprenyl-6-methoxyphenol hydroxylase-like FAD-dependent oxidoreductase
MEAVFAHVAEAQPGVTVRRGAIVRGLLADSESDVPQVTGVVLDGGERLGADLVVDATGRRSKVAGWLGDLGAAAPDTVAEESGFVYYTRYFAGPGLPVTRGPAAAEHGSMSVLTIPGDNGTWSVTVWTATADTALRGLRDPERLARAVAACPLQAQWLDGEPITDVLVMAGILDRYRRFVVDGRPIATGVLAVGDAWGCTNPSAGRGLSVGLLHAQRLRDAVREGIDDGEALVYRFDKVTEEEAAPFVRNQLAADRARIAEMAALREGSAPPPADPRSRAIGAAMMRDPEIFRAMVELNMCLALPPEVFARPGLAERVAAVGDASPGGLPGPNRAELLELVA